MKCPACGFETPDSQAWCDFCKEPLSKPLPQAVRKASDAPQPAAASSKIDLTPEQAFELLKQDPGEKSRRM